ncbi:Ropporin-1-like protein [Physocladia obscura]|uniref:Ropporin-1-like protein n=1 Tax=Physocladia obscura TaxID=109957 RepID=A0AAD5X891_9FUNG|nr:Ropporin-1-like protein [Physocladia obscura]
MNDKEPLYCAEQIKIPPDLPDILKNYTKHIIRTQPADIMTCSAEYFARLSKQRTQMGKKLTNHQLEAFYIKVSKLDRDMITRKEIEEACNHASVSPIQVNDVISLGGWNGEKIPWLRFWALLVASASGTLIATIESVCHLLSDNGNLPSAPLMEIISFMAERDPTQDQSKIQNLLKIIGSSGPTVNADMAMVSARKEVK